MSLRTGPEDKASAIGLVSEGVGAFFVRLTGGGDGYSAMVGLPLGALVGGAVGGCLRASKL
ncbi:hypothetical protein LVO79_13140 [Roseivivax marinus]|uniref:hypothetical protein n=1 Tax=Roseivivax marinus TaxID=1379903 RepID=UPI001F032F7C|nr:hypothetical protein [Roseivivax marinus]UMA63965.1 hypothetical protein LVO79_13140 [Roseivivax marinus]